MLMHEWIRYRSQQVKQAFGDAADSEEAVETDLQEAVAEEAEPQPEEVAEAEVAAEEQVEEQVSAPVEAVETVTEEAKAPPVEETAEQAALRQREAVIDALHDELDRAGQGMRERLEQLRARQRQLPIEIEQSDEEEEEEERPRRATETRQELVQRLLDPTMTLREVALLLDVCPTTVRRYTNRGLLNCFRTPGNQRRFHLSDVLDFMERREFEDF